MAITLDGTSGITSPALDSTGTTTISTNNVALRLKDSSGSLYEAIKATSSNQLQLSSGGASSSYLFYANAGTLKLRIDNDGLKFNSDTAAANALDDYEEGTWTPAFNLVTVTHTAQYGRYVKIGRLVYCKARIQVSSIDNTDVSGIQLTVPFTANSAAAQGGGATAFAYDSATSTLMDGSHAEVHGAYVAGTTFAVTNDNGGNMTYSQLTQTSGIFQFAFTFEATT